MDLSTNPITIIIIYHFYFAHHLQWLQTVAFSLSKCILLKSLQCPVVRWKKSINIIRLIMATMNNCISPDGSMDCHIVTTTRLSSDSCIAMAETHRFHRHGSRRGDSPTGMETDVMHSHRDVKMWKYRRILLQCCYCRASSGKQEAQLMLTTGSTHLAVSRGQQTWYHSTCYI